ncbi:hypothetical protein FRC17_002200, partial [Serendipita sp. 399]
VLMNTVSGIMQDMLPFYTLSLRYVDDTVTTNATPSSSAAARRPTIDASSNEVGGFMMGAGMITTTIQKGTRRKLECGEWDKSTSETTGGSIETNEEREGEGEGECEYGLR